MNLHTLDELAIEMYKLEYHQLSDHQKEMVDYEFQIQLLTLKTL